MLVISSQKQQSCKKCSLTNLGEKVIKSNVGDFNGVTVAY